MKDEARQLKSSDSHKRKDRDSKSAFAKPLEAASYLATFAVCASLVGAIQKTNQSDDHHRSPAMSAEKSQAALRLNEDEHYPSYVKVR